MELKTRIFKLECIAKKKIKKKKAPNADPTAAVDESEYEYYEEEVDEDEADALNVANGGNASYVN